MGGCFNIFFFYLIWEEYFFLFSFLVFKNRFLDLKNILFLLFREEKENIFSYYSLEGEAFEIYEIFFFFFPPKEEKEQAEAELGQAQVKLEVIV